MTTERALRNSVRYYVYLMCFLTAVVLFLGSSPEPFVTRILLWLFFCLIVYRGLYKHYFMTEAERQSWWRPFLLEYQRVTFIFVVQAIVAFLLLWGLTYTNLTAFMPVLKPYANLIGFVNGLIYSILFLARASIE